MKSVEQQIETYQKWLGELRSDLANLHSRHQVVSLKTGTEIEDMQFDEIHFLRQISQGLMPLVVKIGGPEARNDMRQCIQMQVDCILAPMVETVYALSNFVETAKEVSQQYQNRLLQGRVDGDGKTIRLWPKFAFNLESITAYQNLDAILDSAACASLSQITIGRGDLSKSMHMELMDEEVSRVTANAIRKIKNRGLLTSVGGGLNVKTIQQLVEKVESHRFNTRHIVFENNKTFQKNPQASLYAALNFEKKMYEALAELFPNKGDFHLYRAEVLSTRLGNIEVLNRRLD